MNCTLTATLENYHKHQLLQTILFNFCVYTLRQLIICMCLVNKNKFNNQKEIFLPSGFSLSRLNPEEILSKRIG